MVQVRIDDDVNAVAGPPEDVESAVSYAYDFWCSLEWNKDCLLYTSDAADE